MTRPTYTAVLAELDLPAALSQFDARVVGTPPLALDTPESDIDLICQADDAEAFVEIVSRLFGSEDGFTIERRDQFARPVVVNFERSGWPVEIYAIAQPTSRQPAWLHFDVERRLLSLAGPAFRTAIRDRRSGGLKTEPAFAFVLGLTGDPFTALSDLSLKEDTTLVEALRAAGYDLA